MERTDLPSDTLQQTCWVQCRVFRWALTWDRSTTSGSVGTRDQVSWYTSCVEILHSAVRHDFRADDVRHVVQSALVIEEVASIRSGIWH